MVENYLKTAARGIGIVLGGSMIGYGVKYITFILLARLLGPGDYGLFSLGLAILSVLGAILLLGFSNTIPRFLAMYKTEEEKRGVVRAALKYTLIPSISVAVILILTSEYFANYIFQEPNLSSVIQFFALMIPFFSIFFVCISTLSGLKEFKYKVYLKDIALQVIPLIAFFILFYFGFGLYAAITAFLVGYIITTVLAFVVLNKKLNIFKKSKKVGREILYFSWPLIFAGFTITILRWTDILILGMFKTAEVVGVYNAALPTALSLTMLSYSLAFVFLPLGSELFSNKRKEDFKQLYKTVTKWIFVAALPIALLLLFFPEQVLNLLFGSKYVQGSTALSILAIGVLINVTLGLSYNILVIIGRTKALMLLGSIAAMINIALNFILIPQYGIVGAAISTSTAISINMFILLGLVYQKIKMIPFDINYVKYSLTALISVSFLYIISKVLFKELVPIWALIPGFILFVFMYAFMFLISKSLNKQDVMVLRAIENKTGIKIKFLREFVKRFI